MDPQLPPSPANPPPPGPSPLQAAAPPPPAPGGGGFGGLPAFGGTNSPFTNDGTMLSNEQLMKLMGAGDLDTDEIRRHKFIAGLLQGTHSGSTGESISNAFANMSDFEQRQFELRKAYMPMMMREWTAYNQQQQSWMKTSQEMTKDWNATIDNEVGNLDPTSASPNDIHRVLTGLVNEHKIPPQAAQAYWQDFNSKVGSFDPNQGTVMSPGAFITSRQNAMVDAKTRWEAEHPNEKYVPLPSGQQAKVTEGRAGYGPPRPDTIGSLGKWEFHPGEGGPDYYTAPDGKIYKPGDPQLPKLMYGSMSAPPITTGGAPPAGGMPPPAGAVPPPAAGAVPPAPAKPAMPPPSVPPRPAVASSSAPSGPNVAAGAAPVAPPVHPEVAAAQAAQAALYSDVPPLSAMQQPTPPGSGTNAFSMQKAVGEDFLKRLQSANDVIGQQQNSVSMLKRTNDLLSQAQMGKASPIASDVALWVKDVGTRLGWSPATMNEYAQKIAGGDPTATQFFEKNTLQLAIESLRQSLQNPGTGGMAGRETQAEVLRSLERVANQSLDPQTIGRLYQQLAQSYQIDQAEVRAMNTWKDAAGPSMDRVDLSKFTPWWQQKLQDRGWMKQLSPGAIGDRNAPPLRWEWRINPANNQVEAMDPHDPKGNFNWRQFRVKQPQGVQ